MIDIKYISLGLEEKFIDICIYKYNELAEIEHTVIALKF
jgi:hypothetical protein